MDMKSMLMKSFYNIDRNTQKIVHLQWLNNDSTRWYYKINFVATFQICPGYGRTNFVYALIDYF